MYGVFGVLAFATQRHSLALFGTTLSFCSYGVKAETRWRVMGIECNEFGELL